MDSLRLHGLQHQARMLVLFHVAHTASWCHTWLCQKGIGKPEVLTIKPEIGFADPFTCKDGLLEIGSRSHLDQYGILYTYISICIVKAKGSEGKLGALCFASLETTTESLQFLL